MKIEVNNTRDINNNFEALKTQGDKSFGKIFSDVLESANTYQKEYESLLGREVFSEEIDLHNILIAGEKAKISLELTLQIRNKAMEAYQEIMRMQI